MIENETVSFRYMREATSADLDLIDKSDRANAAELPDRLLQQLRLQANEHCAYQVTNLRHSLQTATRAERAGADEDWIVGALLHDVFDTIAPLTHAQMAAELLSPFLREQVVWVVQHHRLFNLYYDIRLPQHQRLERVRFAPHPHYQAAVDFVEFWDQRSYDPHFDDEPLEHFEPMLRRVFAREPYSRRKGAVG